MFLHKKLHTSSVTPYTACICELCSRMWWRALVVLELTVLLHTYCLYSIAKVDESGLTAFVSRGYRKPLCTSSMTDTFAMPVSNKKVPSPPDHAPCTHIVISCGQPSRCAAYCLTLSFISVKQELQTWHQRGQDGTMHNQDPDVRTS